MNEYLFMRNNKQTGPYSLGELLKIGFKPYDLVWIEGKSAMWRYPSEIAELKDYTEAVEEQPYDRFYTKKNNDDKKPVQQNSTLNKQVFVSMPKQSSVNLTQSAPTHSKPIHQANLTNEIISQPEVKYSRPLEDIKKMYAKNLLDKKQPIAKKKFITNTMKKTVVYLGLVAMGIVISYFFISNTKNIPPVAITNGETHQELVIPVANHVDRKTDDGLIVEETIKPIEETSPSFKTTEEPVKTIRGLQTEKKMLSKPGVVLPGKEDNGQTKPNTKKEQVSPGVVINPVTGERNKRTRNENEDAISPPVLKGNNLIGLVSVSNNNYQRGAFGGIRNLELTVTNQSKYLLDKVIVELQYLKPSEQSLKSEKIQFTSIPADGTLTIAVPPSNRGIKISCKIIKVESKELNKEMANL